MAAMTSYFGRQVREGGSHEVAALSLDVAALSLTD
jgi:hypothetical protein